ncbi:MAG: 2OG-Fe(II) oxygenase [Acidobacteria bacterium]|nr:2OG-Fe(II) oxygenase [Acidobacteriota bacterium]
MTADAPFRVDQHGARDFADPLDWRRRFAADGVLALPQILAQPFLTVLLERVDQSTFGEDVVGRIGTRHVERPQRVGRILSLALHGRPLLDWLEVVTGCVPLRAVTGLVAQHGPNSADALHWHDDMNDRARKLAIVINLSGRPFQGGQFQLRRKGSDGLLLAFDHVEPGSALLFAVRPELEHRVLPVTGTNPRRVYAGWFLDRPESGGLSLAQSIGRTS